MDTAQTIFTQGNATQRVQAVTSIVPWLALIAVAGLIVFVLIKRKGK